MSPRTTNSKSALSVAAGVIAGASGSLLISIWQARTPHSTDHENVRATSVTFEGSRGPRVNEQPCPVPIRQDPRNSEEIGDLDRRIARLEADISSHHEVDSGRAPSIDSSAAMDPSTAAMYHEQQEA